tara:strand:- start:4228 stop:4818 length:591 start_codon:yes stop_codon:yes gene_type:complete
MKPKTNNPSGSATLIWVLIWFLLSIDGTADAQRSKLLIEHPFIHAARIGDLALVRDMIARGETPEVRDQAGQTPLMIATIAGDIEMVAAIIGATQSVDLKNNNGNTALALAAIQDQPKIGMLLLGSGANPNAINRLGMSPLMLAAKNGRLIQVELMLRYKRDTTLKDYTGRGPLGWARQSRYPRVVRLLEKAGFVD